MRRDHEGVRFGPSRDREGAVMGATAFYEPRPEEAVMRRDHEGVRFGPSRDR